MLRMQFFDNLLIVELEHKRSICLSTGYHLFKDYLLLIFWLFLYELVIVECGILGIDDSLEIALLLFFKNSWNNSIIV